MRSVDRVFKFIDLPSEEPKPDGLGSFKDPGGGGGKSKKNKSPGLVIENVDALAYNAWPHRGQLDAQKLSVKYTEGGQTIIKDLSFSVEGGQRVGQPELN